MKVGLIGGSGYAGVELLRILAGHPLAEVVLVTSRKDAGQPLCALFPALSGLAGYDQLVFEEPEARTLAGRVDFFFMATPHGAAMELAPDLLNAGARIVDLSADFRLDDPEVFAKWYQPHTAPDLLAEAVYGLPELYAETIKTARLVANPGCYPTSVILGLAPFIKAGLLHPESPLIADSKSGVSGAGRGAALGTSFCEVQDSFKAYKILGHRHTPEIEQELSKLAGRPLTVAFTPHLVPMNRGILSTIYARPTRRITSEDLTGLYREYYAAHPFVRVRPAGFEPQCAEVRGSNFCDISVYYDDRSDLVKIISIIDNLCRGAAGQAAANFNLMCGNPEGLGLAALPLKP